MRFKAIVIAAVGAGVMLGSAGTAASSYNPMKWLKKPTASEQLAANTTQEKELTMQLQALLPEHTTLKDACTAFKTLDDCVASLHASGNLKIKFNCLKWHMTGLRPGGDVKACEAPTKAESLYKSIRVLKPNADARAEARSAERSAREDIKNASR